MAAPRYTLILGDFYILYPDLPRNGPEPDGDTINFLPDTDELIRRLPRFSAVGPDRRHLGTYGVRFEGIDALETPLNNQHQNLSFARAARDHMLARTGFGEVTFLPDRPNKVDTAEHHPIRGYLLANGIESNGRVLAQVYPGEPELDGLHGAADGDRVFVDTRVLDASANTDLVHHVRELVTATRTGGVGFWPQEHLTTSTRLNLHGLTDLSELIMFPKLYRRLVAYFQDAHTDLTGFDTWIRADPIHRDDRVLLPSGEIGNLHDTYNVNTDGITLRHLPEQLMFEPDPVTVATPAPA